MLVSHRLSSIETAIEAIAAGKAIIVMDAEDRENEGDFICAAEKVTPEMVNFMITHGRGQLCMPVLPEMAERLELPPIVENNTAPPDGIYRAGGLPELPHGRDRAGAGQDDPRNPQPAGQAVRFRAARASLPVGGQRRRRVAACRTYRVCRRSGADGRPETGRRADAKSSARAAIGRRRDELYRSGRPVPIGNHHHRGA